MGLRMLRQIQKEVSEKSDVSGKGLASEIYQAKT